VGTFASVPFYLATTRLHAETKTLGQSVQVHREILRMLHGHFGHVPPTWVYGYAHARFGPRDRGNPWVEARFILGLIAVSFATFLRYNRRVPRSEWRRWGEWLRGGWRRLWVRGV
jgi:hypothetical protein